MLQLIQVGNVLSVLPIRGQIINRTMQHVFHLETPSQLSSDLFELTVAPQLKGCIVNGSSPVFIPSDIRRPLGGAPHLCPLRR